jgi:hypothetical protein
MATNPTFSFVSPRYFTAYAESVFPVAFFVDGRKGDQQLNMADARSFFQGMRMPANFFRPNISFGLAEVGAVIDTVFAPHPIQPGNNHGVGNYVLDPTSANFNQSCTLYRNFVNNTIRSLYPKPTGVLLKAINTNLNYFYEPMGKAGCKQVILYGQ